MTALSVVLLVLFGVILLVLAVLLLKLSVRVVYDDGVRVYGGVSFVNIRLYPRNKKDKRPKKHKTVKNDGLQGKKKKKHLYEKKISDKTDGVDTLNKAKEKMSVSETVCLIFDIVKQAGKTIGRHGEIYVKKLIINVSKPEACDTAVTFGVVCASLGTGLALTGLFKKAKINRDSVYANPDFLTGKSDISCDIKISVRGIHLVIAAMKILVNKYLKNS